MEDECLSGITAVRVASDQAVPHEGIGTGDEIEDPAAVTEVATIGDAAEGDELAEGGGIGEQVIGDELTVKLLEPLHGRASLKEGEDGLVGGAFGSGEGRHLVAAWMEDEEDGGCSAPTQRGGLEHTLPVANRSIDRSIQATFRLNGIALTVTCISRDVYKLK